MGWMYAGTTARNVRVRRWRRIQRHYPERVAALQLARPRERMARFPTSAHAESDVVAAAPSRQPVLLQPITIKPLQPFVLRESACDFLECRSTGRRCMAAGERPVQLEHQIAFCLGERHQMCGHFQSRTGRERLTPTRRLAYAAVVIVMVGLLALAVMQATGPGTTLEMGRTLGLS